MKKIILILVLLLAAIHKGNAQCDPNNPITTDPNSPNNTECPIPGQPGSYFFNNTFDWINGNANPPTPIPGYKYWEVYGENFSTGNPINIVVSPFYNPNTTYPHLSSPIYGAPDDKPFEGWELIKNGMGFLYDANGNLVPDPAGRSTLLYFILYNKYTAKLRVLVSHLDNPNPPINYLVVRLRLEDAAAQSALLNHHNNISQPLSEKTGVTIVQQSIPYLNDDGMFMVADFQMAYDACVCNFNSMLKVDFFREVENSIDLYGRYSEVNAPIRAQGKKKLNGGTSDFLTAVYSNELIGNQEYGALAGMHVEQAFNGYYDAYKSYYNQYSIFEKQYKGLKNVKEGLKFIKDNPIASAAVKSLKIAAYLKGFGLAVDFTSVMLNFSKDASQKNVEALGAISLIDGEMAITGNITQVTPLGGGIKFFNPGSDHSLNDPCDQRYYPYYNEPLGLFALLEKPKVKYYEFRNQASWNDGSWLFPDWQYRTMVRRGFQLAEPLKYHLNPVAGINLENTKIYANYAMKKVYMPLTPNQSMINFEVVEADLHSNQLNSVVDLRSEPVPLDCFQSVYSALDIFPYSESLWDHNDFNIIYQGDLLLQLTIMYEFDGVDDQGNPEKKYSSQVLTYPISLVNDQLLPVDGTETGMPIDYSSGPASTGYVEVTNHPVDITIPATHYTTNQLIYAKNKITITGNQTTDPGVSVQIRALNEVEVVQTADIIPGASGDITLDLGEHPYLSCTAQGTTPVDNAYLTDYCDQNSPFVEKYQALIRKSDDQNIVKDEKDKEEDGLDNSDEEKLPNINLILYPNPTSESFYASIYNEANNPVTLEISDLTGKVVLQPYTNYSSISNNFVLTVNTNELSAGIYFCTLTSGNITKTEKLIIVK